MSNIIRKNSLWKSSENPQGDSYKLEIIQKVEISWNLDIIMGWIIFTQMKIANLLNNK